jgi:hypothetical protein
MPKAAVVPDGSVVCATARVARNPTLSKTAVAGTRADWRMDGLRATIIAVSGRDASDLVGSAGPPVGGAGTEGGSQPLE